MGLVTVQSGDFVQLMEFAVDAHLGISALAHLLEKFLVMSLPSLDHRRQKVAFPVLVVLHDQGNDLLVGVTDHGLAGLWRICCRCTGIQKTEEIVDFSYGSDGRTRVVARGLLLDRDDRA